MTISTTTTTITHLGNGATTVFSFPFVGVSEDDLIVSYTNTLGVVTVLNPSLYTVALNAVPVGGLWGIGGFVTYPNTGSPPTAITTGTTLSISRAVPYEQTVSIGNQGAFYPQAVEQGLDLLELQIQQVNTDYEYTLKFPQTDASPPNTLPSAILRADGYLAFDEDGQPIITTAPTVTNIGSTATPRRVTTTGTATIAMTTSDSFGGVSIYQSSTPVTTIQLPTTGGPYPIFDGGANAGTYPILVLPPVGKTILGSTSYYLAFNGVSATFYIDSTQVLVG